MKSLFFNRIPKIFILGFLFLGFTSCSNQVSDELSYYINKQLTLGQVFFVTSGKFAPKILSKEEV